MTPPHQIGHIYMLWFIFIHTHTQIHCICVQWGTYGQDPRVKCPSGDLILVWCPIYRRASHQHSTSKLALVQATGLICITASPTPFMQTNIGCVQSSQSSALTYSHITTQHKMNTCFLWKVPDTSFTHQHQLGRRRGGWLFDYNRAHKKVSRTNGQNWTGTHPFCLEAWIAKVKSSRKKFGPDTSFIDGQEIGWT